MSSQPILSATVVLPVEAIEPLLPFWRSLGFEVTVEVPEGDRLGFVILAAGSAQIMMQTLESIRNDAEELTPDAPIPAMIFLQVDDLEASRAGLVDAEVVIAYRETFYGARETIVRDPGGNVVNLAEMTGQAEE